MNKENNFKLSKRELGIMHIYWSAENPLKATEVWEIVKEDDPRSRKITIFAIQKAIKALLEYGALKVSDYVRVGKTAARAYVADITQEEYAVMQYEIYFPEDKETSVLNMVEALLDANDCTKDDIEKLVELLEKRRSEPDTNE